MTLGPNKNNIKLATGSKTSHVSVKLPYRIQPVCVHCLLAARALGNQHSPFASVLTSGVLPLRLYALLEKVKVCS